MDRTVPLAAARMLDFVRATEVGTDGPSGYNVIFGFNQDKLDAFSGKTGGFRADMIH